MLKLKNTATMKALKLISMLIAIATLIVALTSCGKKKLVEDPLATPNIIKMVDDGNEYVLYGEDEQMCAHMDQRSSFVSATRINLVSDTPQIVIETGFNNGEWVHSPIYMHITAKGNKDWGICTYQVDTIKSNYLNKDYPGDFHIDSGTVTLIEDIRAIRGSFYLVHHMRDGKDRVISGTISVHEFK